MAIEAIIDRIIGDAKAEAEKILTEARKKADEIEKEGKTDIENTCSGILKSANEEARQKRERLKIHAKMEFEKGELEEKQEAITAAFDFALKEIQSLEKIEYQELIKEEFLKAEGVEEVILSADEGSIDEEFITKINKLLVKNGKSGNLKLSDEKRSMPGGGFILKKGNIEINNTFKILFESIRNLIELKISKILFVSVDDNI